MHGVADHIVKLNRDDEMSVSSAGVNIGKVGVGMEVSGGRGQGGLAGDIVATYSYTRSVVIKLHFYISALHCQIPLQVAREI